MTELREREGDERELVKDVVIVGSGCACWMSACYLKCAFPALNVTVLEQGSGCALDLFEDTGPEFQRDFCDRAGLSEVEWMRSCDATFKVAAKFVNWRVPRSETPDDHYYRLYDAMPLCDDVPLADYWPLQHERGGPSTLEYACYPAPKLLDARLGPQYLDGSCAMPYAWQFDARSMAAYLRAIALGRGVRHIVEPLDRVELGADGSIGSLVTQQGRKLTADLFLDCSGFRGRLINEALGEPFLDMSDCLPCDHALSMVVRNDDALIGVDPYTSAIALKAGWAMKVPLLERFGSHYFYSSRFTSEEEAARELSSLWGIEPNLGRIAITKLRAGRNRRSWVKNCVSIGRSSAFIEPLEMSHVRFVQLGLAQLVQHFPARACDSLRQSRFNQAIAELIDQERDLVQVHYATTPRSDEPFWPACRRGLKFSSAGSEKLHSSFWTDDGYGCVLAAMGWQPELPSVRNRSESRRKAQQMFKEIRQASDQLYARLPTNHELLRRLHG
jgi:tryptophan 6-halogenase